MTGIAISMGHGLAPLANGASPGLCANGTNEDAAAIPDEYEYMCKGG